MSTITSALPAKLKMDIAPAEETPTTTMFGIVCPAVKLRSDAKGRASPAGHPVRQDLLNQPGSRAFKITALRHSQPNDAQEPSVVAAGEAIAGLA